MGVTQRTALEVAKTLARDLEHEGRYGQAHAVTCFGRILPLIDGIDLKEAASLALAWVACSEWTLRRLRHKGLATPRYEAAAKDGAEGLRALAKRFAAVDQDLTPRRTLLDPLRGVWKK